MDYRDQTLSPKQRADSLLAEMTTAEKVGQMIQISYADVTREEALKRAKERGAGSFLHVLGDEARELQQAALNSRLGIPIIFGIDATHGHGLNKNAEIFPTQLGLAASFDEELAEQAAKITAHQVREDGLHWTFSPLLCLGRDLRWGRVNETFGEDQYLAGKLGAAMVRGYQGENLQGEDSILACAKHYIAYGESTGGRDSYDSSVTMRKVRDEFLPPFAETFKAGCGSVMAGYQSIDGVPCSANVEVLRTILKDEAGFDGFVVTDWANVRSLVDKQFVAKDIPDACRQAVLAGNDMIMNTPEAYEAIIALLDEGKLDITFIDDSVRRILTVKFRLGLFDKDILGSAECNTLTPDGHADYIKVNKQLTYESIILLKNDGILPITQDIKRMALIGPNADDPRNQMGDWTYYTHPRDNPHAVPTRTVTTVRLGLEEQCHDRNIELSYVKGCEIDSYTEQGIADACDTAKSADVTVLVLGDSIEQTGEAKDRSDLNLPDGQMKLFHALRECCTNLVVVMLCSKPLVLGEIPDQTQGLIQAFNCGLHGGEAIAKVLFGEVNPCGKLPISYPRTTGQLPVYYNQLPGWHGGKYMDCDTTPLYPFGYGLSYSHFHYSNLSTNKSSYQLEDTIAIGVELKNDSSVEGTEVVQLYVNDLVSSLVTPVKQLKAYQRVTLPAHTKTTVTFDLPVSKLGFVGHDCKYIVEPGEFEIMVGGSSWDKEQLHSTITVI